MDPALTAIFAGLFAAGAAAAIAVYRRAPKEAPESQANGRARPDTGAFVREADLGARMAEIGEAIMELHRLALEERSARSRDKLRSEAVHSLCASVEMLAIQQDQLDRKLSEILREIRSQHQ